MHKSELFRNDMRSNGFDPSGTICEDGKSHRFNVSGDKPDSENGYYLYSDYGTGAVGTYGSLKTGVRVKWSSKGQDKMSVKEKTAFQDIQRQHDVEHESLHAEYRQKAASAWKRATTDGIVDHPYSVLNELKPFNVRIDEYNNLLIPIRDMDSTLHGLQYIKPDGVKKFMLGTSVTGNFFLLGKNAEEADAVIICEDYATGSSLRLATKLPVVIAFNAQNLKPVAEVWRAKLPETKIVIAGNDDHASDWNLGRTKAIEAARAVNGIPVFPEFEDNAGNTDFNDMFQVQGIDAVKKLVLDACAKDPENIDDDIWLEPILFGSIDTPDIPSSLLPEELGNFCEALTEHTQTASALSVMMVLAVVATCLQKRFEVAPYGDSDPYTEPVNIMSVTAVDSGTRKTAIVSAATKPLLDWEETQEKELKDKAVEVQHKRDMLKKSIKAIKAKFSKPGTTDKEWIDASKEIKLLEQAMPEEIILPKLWVDDVTVEKLGMMLAEHGERMSVISDEGGFFEVISGLYKGGNTNINAVLQSHAGSSVRVQRMGRAVTLTKPALTLGLAVQPEIVASLATGKKAGFRNNGMLARLLFCIPESIVGSRDVTERKPMPKSVTEMYHETIHRLLAIKPLKDDFGKERPRILTLAPDALERWQKFSQSIENKQGTFGEYYSIRDWTCKLPGAVLRIAGSCHVVEYGTGKNNRTINKVTINRAIKLAKLLIIHAKVAFGMMGCDQAISDAKVVLHWIVSKSGKATFHRSNLQSDLHGRFPRLDRLKVALKVLEERHIISCEKERHTGSRPIIYYNVNPSVLKGGLE